MTKSLRPGKVFLDWCQNTGAKTTISPYSLRGTRPSLRRRPPHLGRDRGRGRGRRGIEPAAARRGAGARRRARRHLRRPALRVSPQNARNPPFPRDGGVSLPPGEFPAAHGQNIGSPGIVHSRGRPRHTGCWCHGCHTSSTDPGSRGFPPAMPEADCAQRLRLGGAARLSREWGRGNGPDLRRRPRRADRDARRAPARRRAPRRRRPAARRRRCPPTRRPGRRRPRPAQPDRRGRSRWPTTTPSVEELVARVSGFGALQRYLDDPTVEEVWINDPSRVFVARAGRHELTSTILTAAQVHELVERMLKSSGRRVDVVTAVRRRDAARGPSAARRARGHRARASRRSTSASSWSGPPGSTTWSAWAA